MLHQNRYSRIALAVSVALATFALPVHAARIDFDSLPSSGLVSDLPAELRVLIPATANASYQKNNGNPNYIYQYDPGNIQIYGNNVTLNGPGAEAFEHSLMVLRNSTSGSAGVVLGDDLTIYTKSKISTNDGKDVDGIRTHGTNTPDNPIFIITGDRTKIYVNGYSGDGINAGYSSYSQGYLGSANIYVGDELYIETTGFQGRGISANAMKNASVVKNNIIVGDKAHIVTRGNSAEGVRTSQNGAYVRLGDNTIIETYGTSSHGLYAASLSTIDLGKYTTITTDQSRAYGMYVSNGTVNLDEHASIKTNGIDGHGIYSYGATGVANVGENSAIFTQGSGAHGVYAYSSGTVNLANNISIAANSAEKSASKAPAGLYAISRGKINLAGNTTLTMAGNNDSQSYAILAESGGMVDGSAGGQLNIKGDLLAAGAIAATSSLPLQNSAITLNMTNESIWNGASYITSTAAGTGNISVSMTDATWNMSNSSTLTHLTLNSGSIVNFQHVDPDSWQSLTINEDFTGDGGKLVFNTVLYNDVSETDKLIVNGNTSGNALVAVRNIGGNGAQTVEGIEIISVGGQSDGVFEKEGRIVAGGYDYNVVQKGNNWYLTSLLEPTDPVDPPPPDPVDPPPPDPVDPPPPDPADPPPPDPVDPPPPDPVDPPPPDPVDPPPPDPVDPVDPQDPVDPTPPVPPAPPGEHQYRPEYGSYMANNYAANTMFITRLHDRLGETQYTDMLTGEKKVTSLWLRNVGGHTRFKDASGRLSTQSNRYVMQLGGDIAQWSSDGLDRWHVGAMAGYGNSRSRTESSLTQYRSRGQVTGYSVGLYGTWYANETDKTGTYVDTWALYNWFDNKVMGEHLATEKYKSSGITASIEAGYSFKVSENERNSYWIQPKAQVIWMDVQADSHREANGTQVKDKTDGNVMTRLGVKAYINGHHPIDDGKSREFQPFIEANWIHNTQMTRVKMDDVSNEMHGAKNIGELKLGVEGQITPRLNMWGNVAQQIGDKGYSDTQGMLGVKYSF
ncbi:autotransporter outer membrane beta-barrel domain-containing protein [Kluyvera intermedia]|uniref:Autotransporter outer membrane beta-barrel domain-containing protein n=1 Tax=Kluyvera intermedia TaxID=61648 RepID=A0ABX6DTC2_KLUIN|nr:autotransporter outer membrane beta-barrel domain-containing protein [Kluyvera intermedia]QGH32067.1 autotransporter outer membrane beta-barrel domain-containing protein [Kluyvera intermedia]QGH41049.1 autotransporter outer membrane beta-barrel domain-containing protein [Kluyvera intermedia]